MRVAIHQPNYVPWLGYFRKIARADVFIFLDDVQFSKGSYTNRVRVLTREAARWLTVPVSHDFGDPVNRVALARHDWARAHLDTLHTCYGGARSFTAVWDDVRALYDGLPRSNLAASNRVLIERLAGRLGLRTRFIAASELGCDGAAGDDRLVALVRAVDEGATYVSGQGGAKYQDDEKFLAAGLGIEYMSFPQTPYDQGAAAFAPGLSVLDAVFHLGWEGAADLLSE